MDEKNLKPIDLGNGMMVLGDDKEEKRLMKAKKIADDICKKKGWDMKNLTLDQIMYMRKFTLGEEV